MKPSVYRRDNGAFSHYVGTHKHGKKNAKTANGGNVYVLRGMVTCSNHPVFEIDKKGTSDERSCKGRGKEAKKWRD